MSETKYKGKTLSLWELLKRQHVEIPIIQRDYAQGRIDKKEVRLNFLNALFDSLKYSNEIRLDFIYGSVVNDSFQPLDGQQRLTTLFLLHWYAAMKEDISSEIYFEILNKFKYETRISSREFCDALITNPITINEPTDSLSERIIDSAWFFLSWKKDPTIDSMLRMIDDIHKKFVNVESLWEKFTAESSLIDFYYVDLEDIGLSDDLYIKMNARGKLLSSFENFKASFEKHIADNKWEESGDITQTFAYKIDSEWTDLFWKHRKKDSIDEAFMRFISTIAMIRVSLERNADRTHEIRALQDNPEYLKPKYFTKEGFKYLYETFNLYQKLFSERSDLKIEFPLFQHKPENTIFTSIVFEGINASYTQKVLFYAQSEYLRIVDEIDESLFQDWMRVVRNIVSRGDVTKNGKRPAIIRSPETFDGVINLIRELSDGCADIYTFLSSDSSLKSTFAKEQIEEEKLKSKIIVSHPDSKSLILDTEDTNLLQGRIEFALFCADYDPKSNELDITKLRKIQSIISTYLDKESHINNDLRRALLTISNHENKYEYYGYWWSFWHVVGANKRCLIDKFRELEFYIYGKYKQRDHYRIYLKKLILKLFDKDLIGISQDFIPPEDMPNWKIKLIKERNLLDDNSKSNYLAIPEDESCCYLLKSIRPRDLEGCERIE